MTVETQSKRSRRALLTAAAGAAAATVVGAVSRPLPVLAAGDDGAAITIGSTFLDVRTGTYLSDQANDNTVFSAVSSSAGGHGGGIGVSGSSGSGVGVHGQSDTEFGVKGVGAFYGVYGVGSDLGVRGDATGTSGATYGVVGTSDGASGIGVFGQANAFSGSTHGVLGINNSSSGAGVFGWAAAATGVTGYSGARPPAALPKTGVYGFAGGTGGRGGVFWGTAAQVKLRPSKATTHPSSGQAGDLFVDNSYRLWFCKGGATWKQIA